MSERLETIPDNVEFSVPTANTEVTINFFNADAYTSANDTETNKYFDRNSTRNRYSIGANKAILITKYNGVALTDPLPIVANFTNSESDCGGLSSITIKTTVDSTSVHCFVR